MIFACAFVCLVIQMSYGQTQKKLDSCYAAIYITYKEFIDHKPSIKTDTIDSNNCIKFQTLSKTLKMLVNGDAKLFKPGSIYGYYDCGKVFRYSPNVELLSPEDYYKVEQLGGAAPLIIYSSVFLGGNELFFSEGFSLPIHRLNINNLSKCFGEKNPDFVKQAKDMNSVKNGLSKKELDGKYSLLSIYEKQ